MISLDIVLDKCHKRFTHWEFNNSFLKKSEFVNLIKEKVNEVSLQYLNVDCLDGKQFEHVSKEDLKFTINDQLFFDTLLMELRAVTIMYAIRQKKKEESVEKDIETEIVNLERLLEHNTNTRENLEKIKLLREELEQFRHQKLDMAAKRLRLQTMQYGEKPSKYFLNLEKQRIVEKTFLKLIDDNGTVLQQQEDTLKEVGLYYERLYKYHPNCDAEDLFSHISEEHFQSLTEEECISLEGEISHSEMEYALKNMKNNKAHGQDGLTVEFFKVFFEELGIYMLRSMNCAYTSGKLSIAQNIGLITLLPKGDKVRHFIKNWRPISLLNVVYKILSSCIFNRLKKGITSHYTC